MPIRYEELVMWNMRENAYPMTDPTYGPVDYHRLQLEYWLYEQRHLLRPPILDIGGEYKRPWMREQVNPIDLQIVGPTLYATTYGWVEPDVLANAERLPFLDDFAGSIVCTETLEHTQVPSDALMEMSRVLRPGGYILLTVPFLWPEHGNENFDDNWRWTEHGLTSWINGDITGLKVTSCTYTEMRPESRAALEIITKYEVMNSDQRWPTGFMFVIRKERPAGSEDEASQ